MRMVQSFRSIKIVPYVGKGGRLHHPIRGHIYVGVGGLRGKRGEGLTSTSDGICVGYIRRETGRRDTKYLGKVACV